MPVPLHCQWLVSCTGVIHSILPRFARLRGYERPCQRLRFPNTAAIALSFMLPSPTVGAYRAAGASGVVCNPEASCPHLHPALLTYDDATLPEFVPGVYCHGRLDACGRRWVREAKGRVVGSSENIPDLHDKQ